MTHRLLALSAAFALTSAVAFAAGAATAAEAPAIHGAKTVGAMSLESRGRPVSAADIVRQGGFAAAGTARWIRTPATDVHASAF